MGLKIEAACGIDTKQIRCGMKSSSRDRDTQIFTVGIRDAGCFEIDGGIEEYKNPKTPMVMIIYMTGIITNGFLVYR